MAIERFNAGEPVSARKFNNLVCALNNLCTSARNLQRGQTLPLGTNNRPKRHWDNSLLSCREGRFCAGVEYRDVPLYLPPFAVLKIGDRLYVKCGVWKTGNKEYVRAGGWFSGTRGYRYIYVSHEGKIILSDAGCNYDWRFYQLLADLETWCAENQRANISGSMTCVSFPEQYWVGDICRPAPRWSQGGVFASCVRRCGKLFIGEGMAYVESPLAVAGSRTWNMGQGVCTRECTLTVVSGYYPVSSTEINIPATYSADYILLLRYKHTAKKGFTGSAGKFTWYVSNSDAASATPVLKCDTAIFSYSVASTSELLVCGGSYGKCVYGSGCTTNYTYDGGGNWGLTIPMGRVFVGAGGVICARVSQKIPEFRARPIINLWSGKVCFTDTAGYYCVCNTEVDFTIPCSSELLSVTERTPTVSVPHRILITYCTCGDDTERASTVYKAPKQNTISETYYTNGNT